MRLHNRFKVEFEKMDVKKLVTGKKSEAGADSIIDARRRRALARLGLASAGASVAPTLLSLRSTAMAMTAMEAEIAA